LSRKPSVAGYFYPQNPVALRKMIGEMVDLEMEKEKALGVISPHAGYQYSGHVAGSVFSSVELPDKFILLGPSHRYAEKDFSIMRIGTWETPLGDIPILTQLADLLLQKGLVKEDDSCHKSEHSLEVQIPFIQYFKTKFSFVPLCIGPHASFDNLVELGNLIAKCIQESGDEILIVASTDMSHYVSQDEAKEKDFKAIDMILKLDPQGLHDIVVSENISMCGYQPTVSALVAANHLGAKKSELVKYQTSGDVTGDTAEVVGYAGLRIL